MAYYRNRYHCRPSGNRFADRELVARRDGPRALVVPILGLNHSSKTPPLYRADAALCAEVEHELREARTLGGWLQLSSSTWAWSETGHMGWTVYTTDRTRAACPSEQPLRGLVS